MRVKIVIALNVHQHEVADKILHIHGSSTVVVACLPVPGSNSSSWVTTISRRYCQYHTLQVERVDYRENKQLVKVRELLTVKLGFKLKP